MGILNQELKDKFDACLELVSVKQIPAEKIVVYKIKDDAIWSGVWERKDLIDYADGYCGNYGGLVNWLEEGNEFRVIVFTD